MSGLPGEVKKPLFQASHLPQMGTNPPSSAQLPPRPLYKTAPWDGAEEALGCGESSGPRRTSGWNNTEMKLLVLLALLFGAISALHLKTDMSNFESSLGDETLPQDKEMPELEAGDAPLLTGEDWGSGSEGAPEEEGALESVSALNELDKNLQCPKEEDTVKLAGSPACKTCRFLLVRSAFNFNQAELTCRRCYRGNLVSIHSFNFNSRIQCAVRGLNQGQVWIGGLVTGMARGAPAPSGEPLLTPSSAQLAADLSVLPGSCKRFRWVDGSSWNFAYWAPGQPWAHGGRCVSLCTRGGQWRRTLCSRSLPFICSY
ncbi:Bone Marrow Proteoglycan [Manis pentadactyla]|nr:Bone Marrow Proteoglycan [Manis pentadactyla]